MLMMMKIETASPPIFFLDYDFWIAVEVKARIGKLQPAILLVITYPNCNIDAGYAGPRLNIKTVLSTFGDFHVKDKTAVRTSYL